ncbi:MAG: type IV pilus secretin PilQ [Legionella sp.]
MERKHCIQEGYLHIFFTAIFFLVILMNSQSHANTNSLLDIKLVSMPDNRLKIDFQFERRLIKNPSSFSTEDPKRLVVDFINCNDASDARLKSKRVNLGAVTKYELVSANNRLRVVFELSDLISYSGSIHGNTYSLLIKNKGHQLIPQQKELVMMSPLANSQFTLNRIDFRGIEQEGGRVIIELSQPGIPIEVSDKGKKLLVKLTSTHIAPGINRSYDVADFHSPTQLITMRQEGKDALVTLLNTGGFTHYAYQVNKQFIVDIFPMNAKKTEEVGDKKKIFTGKRISLNLQNVQVRALLQILADFAGTNIVVNGDAARDAVMTLRLNNIPWDQAMDVILSNQGLDKRQVGNVILVDKTDAFSKRENEQMKVKLDAKKLAPLQSELLQINYAKAADIATMLKDKSNSLLSERGTLSIDARTNTIWLQDTAEQIETVRSLVKKLDIPVRQVLIEARIVDMTKDSAQDLGVRFGVSKPTHLSGKLTGANSLTQGVRPSALPIADRLNLDLAAAPVSASPASIGVALAKLGNGVLLDLELSALESEGRAEIIASPRLMTINQQSAMIQSGQDIPYQEATSSGATSVSFKKAVLSLKVTPQITPDGKLLMDLQINQDADSGQRVQGVPIILTKSIQTNVLVDNGQTIVLGGIYKQDKNNSLVRVPFLGNIPMVGALFKRTQTTVKNEELLIFITPKIITNNLALTTVQGDTSNIARVEMSKPTAAQLWKE